MPIRARVLNGHVASTWAAIDRYARGTRIIIPLVGVTYTTPVRHVSSAFGNFPGRVTDTFTVIHTPVVKHAILGTGAPRAWISVTVGSIASTAKNQIGSAKESGVGRGLL